MVKSTYQLLIEKLTKAWCFFYQRGFIEGFGHISARTIIPDEFYLSRHSLGIETNPDDFLLMNLDGRKILGNGSPPGEFPIHTEIYRNRADVGSILHFHGLYSTAFTMSDRKLRPSYFLSSIFNDGIPLHPDSRLVSNKERGASMVQTLKGHRAVLLKAHGAIVTGKDIEEMVANSFILEDNAHRSWVSATLGEPLELDPEVMAEVKEEFLKTRGPFQRIWALCESETRKGGK